MNNLLLGIIVRPHESPKSLHHNRKICGGPGVPSLIFLFFFFKGIKSRFRPKTFNRKGLSWMDSWYSDQNLQALWQTWSSEEHLSSHWTCLPFALRKVLLDLGTDGLVDVLIQSCVSGDPDKHTRMSKHTPSVAALHPTEAKKKHWNIRAEEGKVSTRGAAEPAHRCTDCWRPSPSGA